MDSGNAAILAACSGAGKMPALRLKAGKMPTLREGPISLYFLYTLLAEITDPRYLTTASRQWTLRAGKIQAKCFS
jgi:hypothetical protein